MFALLALITFILAIFKVPVGVDLLSLGLAFISTHLLFGSWPNGAFPWPRRNPNP